MNATEIKPLQTPKPERQWTIAYPLDLEARRYVGVLRGVRVESTGWFNVLPEGVEFEGRTLETLGFLFAENPFEDAAVVELEQSGEYSPVDLTTFAAGMAQYREKTAKRLALGKFDLTVKPQFREDFARFFTGDAPQVVGFWDGAAPRFVRIPGFHECKKEPVALKQELFSRNSGILESDFMLQK
ncbi:MAG: hypothetical protein HUK22_05330, partial [Thermoguttaceae bacterium]|nr:hypothetical protein [Thermoguttaceae bacterium]